MVFADLKNDFVFRRIGIAKGEAIGIAKGEAIGIAKGQIAGKIDALLAILTARGIAVGEAARSQIEECDSAATLDRWVARAVTASSVEEVLATAKSD
ncbi:MAG: hypothetical protein R3F14_16020 [Polyangiaceae bacterium]